MLSQVSNNASLKEIISYTYPSLYTGKSSTAEWYIGFYAFDPAGGKMRRKKIKVNHIKKVADRKKYANSLIHRLTNKLENGWNPWIEAEHGKAYHHFTEVCDTYRKYITKLFNDGVYREDTFIGYASYLRNMEKWNAGRKIPITYIYQLDQLFISEFLDHVYVERDNSAQTRNNYLAFMSLFCSYLVQHQYAKTKASDGIIPISKRNIKKERVVIPEKDMIRLHDLLNKTNKHYLLACYFLHYMLIRPKEMSLLKLENISIANRTVFIPDDVSKNKKSANVTLPVKVIKLMIDLELFKNPSDYYIFSNGFRPGVHAKSEKQFRDYWDISMQPQ